MIALTINGEERSLPAPLTLAELLLQMGYNPLRLAVEVNGEVIPGQKHAAHAVKAGDQIEIVTLVGGGSGPPEDRPLVVGKFSFRSRLFTGTGKYANHEQMRDCLAASGCEVTTVAVRRERLIDREGA